MSAHLYWRLNFSQGNNGNNPALAELAMHTSVGGSNVCTGGTAGGTSINASFPAANAFDGSTSTDCQTTAATATLSYQFASAQAIVEYTVTSSATLAASYGPSNWTFEYSDDGSTWTVAAYVRNQIGWGVSETRTYPVNAGAELGESLKAFRQALTTTILATVQYVQIGKAPTPGPKTVSGTVTVNGTATSGLLVRAYAKATGEFIGQATSASDGTYSIKCGADWADVYVIAFDPTTYQAIIYDQVVPG
ncbi:Uncharacterised protein [Burkholderia pseudomallei]|nr:Uncharacterised protein [Burkholderia pseudomallei]